MFNVNSETETELSLVPSQRSEGDSSSIAREIYDWIEIFILCLASVLVIVTFIVRLAYVDGPSMMETLHDRDILVVSNLFYKPKQGDVVVFESPDSHIEGGIVKRVIATENQVVDIDFDSWTVTVDGVVLDESYVNFVEGASMNKYDVDFPVVVPEGCVFVMGDNRNRSNDSRGTQIGFVDTRYIFGHVLFRVFPISDIGAIK